MTTLPDRCVLGIDVGTNSVGTAWIDLNSGEITTGLSIFPAGVEESDDKRGDPKNTKRRMCRRTRITLARRSARRRGLRAKLIEAGLLPKQEAAFKELLENTDPWELRRKGLSEALSAFEFGRVLLHLAQRRGALGLRMSVEGDGKTDKGGEEGKADEGGEEDGKVKAAIHDVLGKMAERGARTYGEYVAMVRAERVTPLVTKDRRPAGARRGPREFRDPIRNQPGRYEHCAERSMIRQEFEALWKQQRALGGGAADLLTDVLRLALDDGAGDAEWIHKGLLFGQRRQSWDLGSLGRCVLEPTERCVPHADMYASRYRMVETVNNLKIQERGQAARVLTVEERQRLMRVLSGPLGKETGKGRKGTEEGAAPRAKTNVTMTDLRQAMGTAEDGWGRATKASRFRFNIEADEDREINTDWFYREVVHGAVGEAGWLAMAPGLREGINRAMLKCDPDMEGSAAGLKRGLLSWGGLDEARADAAVAAWRRRPRPDAKRLNLSRKAVRNLLQVMDRPEPWPDPERTGMTRWLTQIEARKIVAGDTGFRDATTGGQLDEHARQRYATGAKGATARDRHYMGKHVLHRDGVPLVGPDGLALAEPPPAPTLSNPVVRKAIHEVRRHLAALMTRSGRRPERVFVELAREAKMGAKDADRLLYRNRLRNRVRNDIVASFNLEDRTSTQQRAAVDRVTLCQQQRGVCPLCGNQAVQTMITPLMAATGEGCEVAHIVPRASGGHNGLVNIVLAHTKCNRDMGRRTPKEFWVDGPGFDVAMAWVRGIYGADGDGQARPGREATGAALWASYFDRRDGEAKIAQFQKSIADIQEMQPRQEAATKYAARQLMVYLADGLFGGKGLPERGGERRIYATDGLWTGRLRREWGLFFDPHEKRQRGLEADEEHVRREKDRGDHRHHAIDAAVIALSTPAVQKAWDERERTAEWQGVNTADEEAMENYRRANPLPPPAPYRDRDHLRDEVRRSVFGEGPGGRPVCHRAVKRRLIGRLHEETLLGPVLDTEGKPTGLYTGRKAVLALEPAHLRMPVPESEDEAIERLAKARQQETKAKKAEARLWAREYYASAAYRAVMVDAVPGKSGLVRDLDLRRRLRECLSEFLYREMRRGEPTGESHRIDPDHFKDKDIQQAVEAGAIRHRSGVPIRSVVLLRSMREPVLLARRRPDHATGRMVPDEAPASLRAYVGGNNHHIEIRADGTGKWRGAIVMGHEAAQRKLRRMQAFRAAGIPPQRELRLLPKAERARLRPKLQEIESAHSIVDRSEDAARGGRFVMSLCEGETVWMRHKETGAPGYFVVAKLDKPQSVVLVPHWDARTATERKDSRGEKVKNSGREQVSVTPNDLKRLAPPGHEHAVKVLVSPIGVVQVLQGD